MAHQQGRRGRAGAAAEPGSRQTGEGRGCLGPRAVCRPWAASPWGPAGEPEAPRGRAPRMSTHAAGAATGPGLTLWMTPAAWMYCGDRERVSVPTHWGRTATGRPGACPPPAAHPHLQPFQHLVDEELDPVLTQLLELHELAQVGAHERHDQVAVGQGRLRPGKAPAPTSQATPHPRAGRDRARGGSGGACADREGREAPVGRQDVGGRGPGWAGGGRRRAGP